MRITFRNSEWWWIPQACTPPSENRHKQNRTSKADQRAFPPSDEQRLLRKSPDRFVSETYTADHRRKIASEPLGFSADLWKQFADLGWLALPIAEAHGGLGGGAIEGGILMEAFGRGLGSQPDLPT